MTRIKTLAFVALFLTAFSVHAGQYSDRKDVAEFINELVSEHQFDREQLQSWMDEAEKKQSIIDAISRPAEKVLTWKDYRKIFIKPDRIEQGIKFWNDNEHILQTISDFYGVNPETIIAILGVETRYGRITGSYRVVDALSTLGFDYPPRSKFFRKQLKEFFLLAREQNQDPLSLKGSYAGAMGYGQFIPSSYRHYAEDFDKDGFADIWNNPADAIASIANYFNKHGWQHQQPVVSTCRIEDKHDKSLINKDLKPSTTTSKLIEKGFIPEYEFNHDEKLAIFVLQGANGPECWAGAKNFYVITRYNHSKLYAMAVYQLSQEVLAMREMQSQPDAPADL